MATLPSSLSYSSTLGETCKDVLNSYKPFTINLNGFATENGGSNKEKDVVLGRNLSTSYFPITEPCDSNEVYMASVLASYHHNLTERTKHQLGYQVNVDYDYEALFRLLHFSINNVGDPFIESTYSIHSKLFEIGVLNWFARLWELEKDEYWGYITNGGTEGNLHGILVGRELFPDGVMYTSKESHYSVFKVARMYRMDCVEVETFVSGEMDCSDFRTKLLQNKHKPAIVNVNIGTTFKGAIDDLDLVIQTLEESGYAHDRFYIHCDGALSGVMIPFIKHASKLSFKKPIGSVSISGHKFIGCPMPCGVQITRKEHINALSRNVEYIGTKDATITGSRNGHAPIFLWYTLNKKGYMGFQKDVENCIKNAQYLKSRLKEAGISVMLNELSNIVVFERPQDEEFVQRWQIACQRNIAHVVVMPHVTMEKLDLFLEELVTIRARWLMEGKTEPSCVASEIGAENCACFCCAKILPK